MGWERMHDEYGRPVLVRQEVDGLRIVPLPTAPQIVWLVGVVVVVVLAVIGRV